MPLLEIEILKVQTRDLPASREQVAALMASVASADDRLWPRPWWPAMRLDRPWETGSLDGHGLIRGVMESGVPVECIVLRFTAPRGFGGCKRFLSASPHILTGLRLLIALPLVAALYRYDLALVVGLLSLAISTDLLDGWLARKLKVCSTFGAYFDAAADFALAVAAFGMLTARGVYPAWILWLIVLMFVQFVWTAQRGQPVYDPVGKYYGAVLYSVMFALSLLPDLLLSYALLAMIVMFSALSLSTRTVWLTRTPLARKS